MNEPARIVVTVEDPDTGDVNTVEVKDNFLLLCVGNTYLANEQIYGNGTVQLTIKRDGENGREPDDE